MTLNSDGLSRGKGRSIAGLLFCVFMTILLVSCATVQMEAPVDQVSVEDVSPEVRASAEIPTPTTDASPAVRPTLASGPVAGPTATTSQASAPPPPTATPTPTRTLSTRPPTRIVIPSIKLDAPVVEIGWKVVDRNGDLYSQWQVPDDAVGFHKGSAYPGNVGNTVLSGHHNVGAEVFRDLHLVEPGDDIYLYVGPKSYHYVVEAKYRFREKGVSPEVQRDNARWIQHTADERLTLVTCWPYHYPGNTHRIVVVAKPAE